MTDTSKRHRQNVAGSFYVVDSCCTACGVPEATAPEMFAYDASDHCFVRKQPVSEPEIEKALQVIRGQELGCVRYGGTDATILRRLAEAGEAELCDHPATDIRPVLRNVVTFADRESQDRTVSLQDFVDYLQLRMPGVTIRTKPHRLDRASLSISWYKDRFHRLMMRSVAPGRWMIRHSGPLGLSERLHEWLSATSRLGDVRWWTNDSWKQSGPSQDRPW